MNSERTPDAPTLRPESPDPSALLAPAHLRTPRPNRAHSAQWLSPGLIMAASGIGASDIITATVGGAKFGTALLWPLALGAFFKLVMTEGLARWQLANGTTLVSVPFAFLDRPLLVVVGFTVIGSLFLPFLAGTLLYLSNRVPWASTIRRNSTAQARCCFCA